VNADNYIELDGDTIEAASCVREASRSIHQGLAMLFYVPPGKAGRKEIDQAQDLMLRAQKRLQQALGKINYVPPGDEGRKEIVQAQDLMLDVKKRLQQALGKIDKAPPNPAAHSAVHGDAS